MAKGYSLKRAIAAAMSNCIERGILANNRNFMLRIW